MKIWLKKIQTVVLALSLSMVMLPMFASAQTQALPKNTQERCSLFKSQFQLTNKTDVLQNNKVFCSASELILTVINYIQIMAGTVTALFLMIGGFLFITSGGNEEQAEKGKKIVTNSVIGLVVIILSYAIVRIVSNLVNVGQ